MDSGPKRGLIAALAVVGAILVGGMTRANAVGSVVLQLLTTLLGIVSVVGSLYSAFEHLRAYRAKQDSDAM